MLACRLLPSPSLASARHGTATWRPRPQPEVRRIGVYKSAGDQLLRTDMSEAQREQLTALLDDIYGGGWARGDARWAGGLACFPAALLGCSGWLFRG